MGIHLTYTIFITLGSAYMEILVGKSTLPWENDKEINVLLGASADFPIEIVPLLSFNYEGQLFGLFKIRFCWLEPEATLLWNKLDGNGGSLCVGPLMDAVIQNLANLSARFREMGIAPSVSIVERMVRPVYSGDRLLVSERFGSSRLEFCVELDKEIPSALIVKGDGGVARSLEINWN